MLIATCHAPTLPAATRRLALSRGAAVARAPLRARAAATSQPRRAGRARAVSADLSPGEWR